ncbi:MAG: transporter substrate-binding domain-containing protein [Boseongicola sp.]|nr:transporter substrate-binding domain-containing protein [Boseongicola sp.]
MSVFRTAKRSTAALLVGFAVTILTVVQPAADTLDEIKSRGHFVFGLEVGYKPFEFRDENNEIVGYDIDVANEIGKRLGVEARPQGTNWATVIQTLYDGGFDLILGGMTATEKRYQRVNFSIPYMDASSGLLVMSNSGIMGRNELGGKTVSAGAGTPQINQLKLSAEELGFEYSGEIKTYDSDAVAYEAMRVGRIDAYASTIVSLLEFAKTTEDFDVLPFASDMWEQEWTAMAFRKEDETLRAAFNEAIRDMKADGTLAALQEKWFGKSFVDLLSDEAPTW